MVDFCASSAFTIALAFVLDEDSVIHSGLPTPTSTPREVTAYGLVVRVAVVYRLVRAVNGFDSTGVGEVAYVGASRAGILVASAAANISTRSLHPALSPPDRGHHDQTARSGLVCQVVPLFG